MSHWIPPSWQLQFVINRPRLRAALHSAHTRLPRPLSIWAYRLGRKMLFKDSRVAGFAIAFAAAPEGDYLEFGVYRGTSIITADRMRRRFGLDGMRLFAFDSFAGLPEFGQDDFPDWRPLPYVRGHFAFAQEAFMRYVTKAGADPKWIVPVAGFYEDIDSVDGLERAAIVHIDCDLYSSTQEVLRVIEPLLVEGTILIFDDWYLYPDGERAEDHGEARAFSEWSLRDNFDDFFDVRGVHRAFIFRRP